MQRIKVNTSTQYEILMDSGLMQDVGYMISHVSHAGETQKICVISDSTVFDIFGEDVVKSLEKAGFDVYKIIFPPGEETKSISCLEKILEYLAEKGFSRTDMLLALGGGVIGDLTGFAAATFLRGVDFVQVPTTLLSAVDASVGGKTAINLKAGKNLAGAFHQPKLVIFDSNTLITLPNDRYKDGISEIIKSGMIANSEFFYRIAEEKTASRKFIMECVAKAVSIKCKLVEADEKEKGQRKLLNFGHTMGHAIEICSGYKISHGHAVAIGMHAFAKAAEKLGKTKEPSAASLKRLLKGYGIETSCPYTPEELANVASRDKKRKGDDISLVIPRKIGECTIIDIKIKDLEEFFRLGLKNE